MGPKRLIGCSPSAWSSDVLGSSKPKKERKKERNTDVLLLNYAVGLEVARVGTQTSTQGLWPCKLPLDSLSQQELARSPDLMSDLRKITRYLVSCHVIDATLGVETNFYVLIKTKKMNIE